MLSIQLGKVSHATRAAKLIDGLVEPEHFSLQSYVQRKTRTRKLGEWYPTAETRALAARIEDQIGQAARSVLEIYHS
jgi:hypothetical protein